MSKFYWFEILFATLIVRFFLGGHAITDFGISIWTISNYFDTRWGTRENADDETEKVVVIKRNKYSLIFPDLTDSSRQQLFGFRICFPQLFQYLLPFVQYLCSGTSALTMLILFKADYKLLEFVMIYSSIQITVLVTLMFVAKSRSNRYRDD